MAEKPKETPSETKPFSALGAERTESNIKKKSWEREEPFQGKKGGYNAVGTKSKQNGTGAERSESAYRKGEPTKAEPFMGGKNEGYKHVGTKSKSGGDGKERTESAIPKKSPWRN